MPAELSEKGGGGVGFLEEAAIKILGTCLPFGAPGKLMGKRASVLALD